MPTTIRTKLIAPGLSSWQDAATLDQTDPALGIQSISLTLSGTLLSDVYVESGDLAPTQFFSVDTGGVTLERPNGWALLTAAPVVVTTATLAAADGTLDYAGASGRSIIGQTATVGASASYYPGTGAASPDAALLVGTGQVTLPVVASARITAVGPGNMRAVFHSAIAASVSTIAETTAAPGSGSVGLRDLTTTMFQNTPFYFLPTDLVASTTQRRTIAAATTGAASAVAVNGFDPSLGQLYAVEVAVDASSAAVVAAENFDPVAASVTISQAASVSVFGANGALLDTAAATDSTTRQLAAFDGAWDWSGASGMLTAPATADGVSQQTVTAASSLALFNQAAPVWLGVATAGVSTVYGPGNLGIDAELKVGSTISVTYLYTPAPAPAAPTDPIFDKAYHLAHNPDVAAAGVDPLAHYLQFGWHEGRDPSAWFDTSYYLAQNPDVKAAGVDPLIHFETFGWKEGRDPSLVFSDAKYLAANPDVAAAGVDPLAHYVQFGQSEGRATFLTGGAAIADPLVDGAYYDRQLGATLIPTGTAAAQQAAWSYDATGWQAGLNPDAWFDTQYYLSHNPDVAAAHIDPLLHYETYGWKEGRDPSAAFSTNKYLAAYADVKAAGVDPLLQFVTAGQAQGRTAFSV
jgi:hypothetical protein